MSRRQHRHFPGQSEERTQSQERVSHQSLSTKEKPWTHPVWEKLLSELSLLSLPAPELHKANVMNVGKALAEVLTSFGIRESTQERRLTSA